MQSQQLNMSEVTYIPESGRTALIGILRGRLKAGECFVELKAEVGTCLTHRSTCEGLVEDLQCTTPYFAVQPIITFHVVCDVTTQC